MRRSIHGLILIISGVGIFGCQHTRPSGEAEALGQMRDHAARDREIQEMVDDAFTMPDPTTRGAAALRATDLRTGELTDTLAGIDVAIKVVADNLRNADTTAFKTTRAQCDGGKKPVCEIDMEQGALDQTGGPLDVAIEGNGFFKVKLPDNVGDGAGYTRAGNFIVNDRSELVLGLADGYRLTPPITIPPGVCDVTIGQDGQISYNKPGSTTPTVAGQITISQFMNPQGLHALNNTIYLATDASGHPIDNNPGENGAGVTLQNYLERSNADIYRERIRLTFLQSWRTAILRAADAKAPSAPAAQANAN